jgi:outer membrane protein assembly factor BamA
MIPLLPLVLMLAAAAAPAGPAEAGPDAPAVAGVSFSPPGARPQMAASEVIADIRVHGNLIVGDDEVIALAGVSVGAPFGPTTLADVAARLRASGRFEHVEVLKRFASIDDPTRIALVLIVNEGPVRVTSNAGSIDVVRRRGLRNLLFLPILEAEDGYGVTYGARLALVSRTGNRRLSFPLTWGGRKEAGAELERSLSRGPLTRAIVGAGIEQRTNPAFKADDTRRQVWGRVERASGPVRAGGSAGWADVSFAGMDDRFRSVGADITFDTRLDPVLPRNALFGAASWERLFFPGARVDRTRVEGRGYLGLAGQTVLAVRALRESAGGALPPYLKPLLGGWSNLRGFAAGSFAGDTIVAESVELRIPLSSPLHIAKIGVSLFADAGTAYDHGERFRDQTMHRSVGAGMWVSATVLHFGVSVAHGRDADTRVNFGGGLSF